MATITQTIGSIPQAGKRGIDARTLFVTKQEAFQDHLTDTLVGELNEFASQTNIVRDEVNQLKNTTEAYKDTAISSAETATAQANLASISKTGAESAYNNTQTLVNNLVIPTEATYNKEYIDDIEVRQFLNFKIGEY